MRAVVALLILVSAPPSVLAKKSATADKPTTIGVFNLKAEGIDAKLADTFVDTLATTITQLGVGSVLTGKDLNALIAAAPATASTALPSQPIGGSYAPKKSSWVSVPVNG